MPIEATQDTKQDPTKQYPGPKFEKQEQPPPGLAQEMRPKPDHGEQSYRGHGRLAGRKALITGGDSGIGRAAAIAFAREGADIAFNYLASEEPDAREVTSLIEAAGRKAFPSAGDIGQELFAESSSKKRVARSEAWTLWLMLPAIRWRRTVLRKFLPINLMRRSKPTCMRCSGSARPLYPI